jgi:predicted nucleic acid-binding protein
MAVRVAVLDANVLYGIEVTDVLLTMATRRLYRPHWSPEILDEVARNLRLRRDLDPAAIDRRITQMNRALPGAAEAPPASLIDEMPVNDKDRHVLALAVHTGAPLIVTENLRDFPQRLLQRYEVEAVSADDFVLEHVERDPNAMNAAIEAMAVRRRRDPKTRHDIIAVLASDLPQAMAALAP